MTLVRFFYKDSRICGFSVSGHSTADEGDFEGKLVCSAVSSAAYMAANTMLEIIGESLETRVDDGEMYVYAQNPCEKSRTVLEGFRLHLTELSKQYSKRIKIITEV